MRAVFVCFVIFIQTAFIVGLITGLQYLSHHGPEWTTLQMGAEDTILSPAVILAAIVLGIGSLIISSYLLLLREDWDDDGEYDADNDDHFIQRFERIGDEDSETGEII